MNSADRSMEGVVINKQSLVQNMAHAGSPSGLSSWQVERRVEMSFKRGSPRVNKAGGLVLPPFSTFPSTLGKTKHRAVISR